MIDADGSTDPREIPRFLQALTDGADYAKGSRFASGGTSHDITPVRKVGNVFLNTIVNVLYRTRYTDLCYGYNAFWRDVLPVLDLNCGEKALAMHWGDGFEIETILNVRAAKAGLRIVEIPSVEQPRIHGESKLNAVRDGLRILRVIATEYRNPPPYQAQPAQAPEEPVSPTPTPARSQSDSSRSTTERTRSDRARHDPGDSGPDRPPWRRAEANQPLAIHPPFRGHHVIWTTSRPSSVIRMTSAEGTARAGSPGHAARRRAHPPSGDCPRGGPDGGGHPSDRDELTPAGVRDEVVRRPLHPRSCGPRRALRGCPQRG
jgi:hypothetical protein